MPAFTQAGVEMVVKGVGSFDAQIASMNKRIAALSGELQDFGNELDTFGEGIDDSIRRAEDFQKGWQTAGRILAGAGAAMLGLATVAANTASRTQELDIVLRTIAKNAGQSMDAIYDQQQAIKDLGITTQVA